MNKLTLTIGLGTAVAGTAIAALVASIKDKNDKIADLETRLNKATDKANYYEEMFDAAERRADNYYEENLKIHEKYLAAADWERKFNELSKLYRVADKEMVDVMLIANSEEEESNLKKKLNEYFANMDKEAK